jgi:transposase
VKLLAPIEHRSAEQQAELAVIRARDAVLRARRGVAAKIHHRAFRHTGVAALPEFLRSALGGLDQIDALSRQVAAYDQRIAQMAGEHPEIEPLTNTPGVGMLTALTFVLTLGRAERFAHSRDVPGFLGLRPKQRQSGAHDPQLGSRKADPDLRKLQEQCSHYVLGHWGPDSALRRGLAKGEARKFGGPAAPLVDHRSFL